MEDMLIRAPRITVLTVGKCQKVLFFFLPLIIETFIPHSKQFRTPPSKLNLKVKTFIEVLRQNFDCCVHCIRMLIDRNVQKKLLPLNFLNIQTHPLLLQITIGFICFIKVSFKNILVVETLSLEIFVCFVPCIGILRVRYSRKIYFNCFV